MRSHTTYYQFNMRSRWHTVNYGNIESFIDIYGISNIFSVTIRKRLGYHITYGSYDGYCKVSKGDVDLKFYEYEQGFPYIDVSKQDILMVQTVKIITRDTTST